MKKNSSYKTLGLIILIGVMILFNSFFVSANIKSYDSLNKEMLIIDSNNLSNNLALIKLNTPISVQTGYGDVFKVAEVNITAYSDMNDALKEIKYYNGYTLQEITRSVQLKVKTTYVEKVDKYITNCSSDYSLEKNKGKCEEIKVGTEDRIREVWTDSSKFDFKKGDKFTIGLFSYVNKGDYVEWIPQDWFGVKINEWATWNSSLYSGIRGYYSFDEGAGSTYIENVSKKYNMTTENSPTWVKGIKGNAGNYTAVNQRAYVSNPYFVNNTDYSISVWYNMSRPLSATYTSLVTTRLGATKGFDIWSYGDTNAFHFSPSSDDDLDYFPNFNYNTWEHIIIMRAYNGTSNWANYSFYHNGVYRGSIMKNVADTNQPILQISGSEIGSASKSFYGAIDELGFWNRTLTQKEIVDLYNGGSGVAYGEIELVKPVVVLNSPTNWTNFSVTNINFNFSVYSYQDGGYINQSELYIDEVSSELNSYPPYSIANGSSIQIAKVLSKGLHNWSVKIWDSNGSTNQSLYSYFNVSANPPNVTIQFPNLYSNWSSSLIEFNATITDDYTLNNATLYIDGVLNETNSSQIEGQYRWNKYLSEGKHNWSILAYDNDSNPTQTTETTFWIDLSTPVINITYPLNTTYYVFNYSPNNTNPAVWFNWSVSNQITLLDKCWFSTNEGSTNSTRTCNTNSSFASVYRQENLTAWANDTLGHLGVRRVSANYKVRILENSRVVPVIATEGSTQTFSLNISPETPVTSAYMYYNGTRKSVSISVGDFTTLNSTFAIPVVDAFGTSTILWEITLSSGTYNSTSSTMSVTDISLDNCSTYTKKLMEFTFKDEVYQTFINNTLGDNTSSKLNLQIYSYGKKDTNIMNFSTSYNLTNPFAVCISSLLNTTDKYGLDTQVEYSSLNHHKEYYHLQNETLDSSFIYENYTLYDLDDTHAQTFRITYKDSSYNPVSNAIIKIQRKYVDENTFKTIEIPLTNYNGETTASLEVDDVLYSFSAYKQGKLLDTFVKGAVWCSNPSIDECSIILGSPIPPIVTENYTQIQNVQLSSAYNRTTRTMVVTFSTTNDSSVTMVLNGTLIDNLGTTSACSTSLTASAGTLTCTIPSVLGNGSAILTLYKDGEEIASKTISLEREPSEIYGGSRVFLLILLYLILIGMAIGSNPMVAGIFLIIGSILGVVLNFVNTTSTNFGLMGATILWFIIAVILVLIKGAKRQ